MSTHVRSSMDKIVESGQEERSRAIRGMSSFLLVDAFTTSVT